MTTIDEIIALALKFECCPYCGNPDAQSHYCDKCKKRFAECDDAYWFARWLERNKENVKGEK